MGYRPCLCSEPFHLAQHKSQIPSKEPRSPACPDTVISEVGPHAPSTPATLSPSSLEHSFKPVPSTESSSLLPGVLLPQIATWLASSSPACLHVNVTFSVRPFQAMIFTRTSPPPAPRARARTHTRNFYSFLYSSPVHYGFTGSSYSTKK